MTETDLIVQRLVRWAKRRDAVRAVLLTSTRANPHATVDIFSDYDVVLVARDVRPFFEDRAWVEDFGLVLVSYWDPIQPDPDHGIAQVSNIIQYADGLKIDFTVWPVELARQVAAAPTLPADLDSGYRVLLDKDHLTDGIGAPSYRAFVPARPSNETFQKLIEDFFSTAPYVAKCLWRDELLPAKWCLDYDMKHPFLRQMLEWRVEIDQGWSAPVGVLGRGLKKRLQPDLWAGLERAFVGAEIAENWQALFATIDVFRQAAVEVAEQLGYDYPHDLDRRVVAYLERVRGLEPGAPMLY